MYVHASMYTCLHLCVHVFCVHVYTHVCLWVWVLVHVSVNVCVCCACMLVYVCLWVCDCGHRWATLDTSPYLPLYLREDRLSIMVSTKITGLRHSGGSLTCTPTPSALELQMHAIIPSFTCEAELRPSQLYSKHFTSESPPQYIFPLFLRLSLVPDHIGFLLSGNCQMKCLFTDSVK